MFILLFLSIYIIYSEPTEESQFYTRDCYESFSIPKRLFILFHYNPTGPQYLILQFSSQIYYTENIENYTQIDKYYHFKKVNGPCKRSTFILTTNGRYFVRMFVMIKFFLSTHKYVMTEILYTFNHGFEPGIYFLIDKTMSYGLEANIIYSKKVPIIKDINDFYSAKFYLRSLHNNKSRICIFTENNNRIVIQPKYNYIKPNGYIIRIKAQFLYNGKYIKPYLFEAFECHSNNNYHVEPKIFITEEYPQNLLYFSAIYLTYTKDNREILGEASFSIDDIDLYHYKINKNYPPNIRKVFLMNKNAKYVDLDNDYWRIWYLSKNGTVYYSKNEIQIQTKPFVNQTLFIKYSPLELNELYY